MGLLALVALVLFGLLGTRLWFLQTVQASPLQERVNAARQKTVYIPPERGRIFDIDGRILADNRRVLTVTVDRQQIRRDSMRAELFARLSGPLGVPVEEMERRYKDVIYSTFLPLPLAEDVDEPTVLYLMQRSEDFPGVDVQENYAREYPYAPLASHVIGYMGAITKADLDHYLGLGYQRNERVGRFGVEMSMESVLHGSWGKIVYEVDSANRPLRVLEQVDPIPGQDVQLTLDLDVQQYAEQALQTKLQMQRAELVNNPRDAKGEYAFPEFPEQVPYKAPAGSVIVMDHSNGHIVAMASYPTFDNRWMNADISGDKFSQLFPDTDDPDRSILVNRAIQGRYNLGSTFKPFVAYAALHSGLLTANNYFEDEGTYKMESVSEEARKAGVRFEYKNATCAGTLRPCVYGNVNVEDALAVSSDTFFYRIGERMMGLPGEALQDQLRLFGFDEDTGIDLPYEFDGVVPNASVKKDYAERGVIKEEEGRGYYSGDNVQLAIGQGLLSATPLQLATGYATFANEGFVMVPEIVNAIYAPGTPDGEPGRAALESGTLLQSFSTPKVARQLDMPPEIRDPIIHGLERVITGPGVTSDSYHKTTGEHLFDPPSWFAGIVPDYPYEEIPIAGKTGTAQGKENQPWLDSSVFAAFSRSGELPYTVTAYLEKAGYGSESAAPVVKCIFMALNDPTRMDPVLPSMQLDLTSTEVATPLTLTDSMCLNPATLGSTIRE